MAEKPPIDAVQEEWRAIAGLEGMYEVSSHGHVRSLDRTDRRGRRRRGRILSTEGDIYPKVSLPGPGGQVKRRVHILVAEAFLGPRPPGAVVRHLDDDKGNCAAGNLAYGTQAENVDDAFRNGGRVIKSACIRGHRLEPWNVVDVGKYRACRACVASTGWIKRNPEHAHRCDELAQIRYEQLRDDPDARVNHKKMLGIEE